MVLPPSGKQILLALQGSYFKNSEGAFPVLSPAEDIPRTLVHRHTNSPLLYQPAFPRPVLGHKTSLQSQILGSQCCSSSLEVKLCQPSPSSPRIPVAAMGVFLVGTARNTGHEPKIQSLFFHFELEQHCPTSSAQRIPLGYKIMVDSYQKKL